MREEFSIYFQPSKEEMKDIWENAVFVADANVLLNLYRYSQDTIETFMGIIKKLSDQFWLPHQVALEYNSNRITVINEQAGAYDSLQNSIVKACTELGNKLDKELKMYKKRHPENDISSRIDNFFETIVTELKNEKNAHPNYTYEDPIREFILEYLGDKLGEPYDQKSLEEIFVEGKDRYSRNFPPGYEDLKEKAGMVKYYRDLEIKSEYGDLIVWKQILDYAKEENKPVIFITDDVKDDWWQRHQGKRIGPRTELLNEFYHNTGQRFYMYESHRFIEYAQTYLEVNINDAAVKEVEQYKINYDKEFLNKELLKIELFHENERELINNLKIVNDNNNRWRDFYTTQKEKQKQEESGHYQVVWKEMEVITDNENNYGLGDEIYHEKYGRGKILEESGYEGDKLFLIRFYKDSSLKEIHQTSPLIKKLSDVINSYID